jgi:hypothetical protein
MVAAKHGLSGLCERCQTYRRCSEPYQVAHYKPRDEGRRPAQTVSERPGEYGSWVSPHPVRPAIDISAYQSRQSEPANELLT